MSGGGEERVEDGTVAPDPAALALLGFAERATGMPPMADVGLGRPWVVVQEGDGLRVIQSQPPAAATESAGADVLGEGGV